MHSIVFESRDASVAPLTLEISKETESKSKDFEKGRVESFEIKDDEELCGCKIHHEGTKFLYGITWLKRKRLIKD
jgi:hypothetical protein